MPRVPELWAPLAWRRWLELQGLNKFEAKRWLYFNYAYQMVQAARSGVQNIAEGSVASGTSRKMELKLTNVAKASLVELALDYEDFLRHRGLQLWSHNDPRRQALVECRCSTAHEVAAWVKETAAKGRVNPDSNELNSVVYPEISANAALVLVGVAITLLDRQVTTLAAAFEKEGGFTERLY